LEEWAVNLERVRLEYSLGRTSGTLILFDEGAGVAVILGCMLADEGKNSL
jgi:hypothetical protein